MCRRFIFAKGRAKRAGDFPPDWVNRLTYRLLHDIVPPYTMALCSEWLSIPMSCCPL